MLLSIGVLACACSSDTFQGWSLESLSASQGFVFRSPIFEVPPGAEIQNCYFVRVPDVNAGADVWVGKTVTALNPGTHHMNVFRVKTIVNLDPAAGAPFQEGTTSGTFVSNGECFRSSNWADWPLVANSQHSVLQDPYTTWQLPDNVAHKFAPGEMLMFQIHYVNASTQRTLFKGKIGVNFYKTAAAAPVELGT